MPTLARKQLFLLCLVFIYTTNTITLAQPDFVFSRCENTDNYTINGTYHTNLDAALSTLPTTNSGFGFYNISTGQGRDTVNSIALCRGDINPYVCTRCLNVSIFQLRKVCPNKKEALIFSTECLLKYSNNTLFGYPNKRDYFSEFNSENVMDREGFNGALRPLMDELRGIAAAGGSLLKFATANRTGPGVTIYALLQCTPDLTEQQCNDCLADEVVQIRGDSIGKIGGKIILPMCYIRFETYQFFNATTQTRFSMPPPRPPPPPPPPPGIQKSPLNVTSPSE